MAGITPPVDATRSDAFPIKLGFSGSPSAARLAMPADRDPADKFYWSGRAVNQDATLTRAVDLSGIVELRGQ